MILSHSFPSLYKNVQISIVDFFEIFVILINTWYNYIIMKENKKLKQGALRGLGEAWQKGRVLALSVLLLFSTQALVSAKTLLEQYLDCNGIEEFVFYHEYPGKTNQYPNMYWSGSYQDGHSLLVFTRTPQTGIPREVSTNQSFSLSACFEPTWWAFQVGPNMFDRKIWEEKNDPREENNEIQRQVLSGVGTIESYLLNLGLDHSQGVQMTKPEGSFTNQKSTVTVDYRVAETNAQGMPTTLLAHAKSLEKSEAFPPATWRNVISYQASGKIPTQIDRFYVNGEGKEDELIDRIVIQKLLPATNTLPREHFLRPEYDNTKPFPEEDVFTFYLQTNQLVGLDAQSNQIVRMSPSDPRVLRKSDKNILIRNYWIVAALITLSLGVVVFKFRKNE